MTKTEIELAQYLHGVWERALHWANRLDPKCKRATPEVRHVDAIRDQARSAFFTLCGRMPSDVHWVELNTEHPAEWLKKHTPGTYPPTPNEIKMNAKRRGQP